MRQKILFQLLIIATLSIVAFPLKAAQRPSEGEAQTSIGQQPKTNTKAALSFTLFQQLMYKSANEVVQYLKQQGCEISKSMDKVYTTNVRGGWIVIYYPNAPCPRAGKGPVEFYTEDTNVRDAWYRGLRKNDYEPCGDGDWCGDNAHKPTFRVIDYIGIDIEADYAGVCTLCVGAYPM